MSHLSLVAQPIAAHDSRRPDPVRLALDLIEGTIDPAAHLAPLDASVLLSDFAEALADLAARRRPRAVVRLCADPGPWELGLERAGEDLLATVFHGGAIPEVALYERRAAREPLADRLLAAIDRLARREPADGALDLARLHAARAALSAARASGSEPPESAEPEVVAVEPTGDVPIVIAADALLRTPSTAPQSAVLRSDVHALLFRGRLRFAVGEQARELPDVLVFALAEQLAALAGDALAAWAEGGALYRRVFVGGAICGIRVTRDRSASLTLGLARRGPGDRAQTWTFPAVDPPALVQGVVAFGRALARTLVRRDRAQASNLRLVAFRGHVRELAERLREATRDDSKVNPAPEPYRAFAVAAKPPAAPSASPFGRARLRFTARWLAAVPAIDLRATFLCGDAFVVGSTREMRCLHRRTGELLWQRPVPRGLSVTTPVGIARIGPDGALAVHDVASGDVRFAVALSPRAGTISGAVVNAPGLPRLLVVNEGARHLAAIDLDAGEVRWRHGARRGAAFRLRRAGRLLVVASGEPALTAIDAAGGEVVWRFCDRLRFASHVAVDHDALFAVAGDGALVGRGGTRLHHLDPWSGMARWSIELPPHVVPVGAPLLAPDTVIVTSHGRRGTTLLGFERATGAPRFHRTASSAPSTCLAVDDLVIVNSESGELVAVDAADGSIRYRHVFGGADADKPRRLEPVLRSGALFVPQSQVYVVRPGDGTLLGTVPAEIVPDLLRVDERCDVYVVEESGHLAAFTAAPRLTLVP